MNPLKILAITDNRPGHQKQTEGVINALSDLTPVEIQHCVAGIDLISNLKNWCAAAKSIIFPAPTESGRFDIVMGAGSHTHAHILRLGRTYGSKKIICMSPAPGLDCLFDLCFVPNHDNVQPKKNFFFTIGPPNLSVNLDGHDKKKGLILIGGIDKKSHKWNSNNIFHMVKTICEKEGHIQWTLSTSPRTPEDIETLLFNYSMENEHINFFKYTDTPEGWIEKAYAANHHVWVTADSISMVYEALSSGCNVGLIPVDWKTDNKFARSEVTLVSKKYVTSYEKWLKTNCYTHTNRSLNEAKRCAEAILQKWWPERLR